MFTVSSAAALTLKERSHNIKRRVDRALETFPLLPDEALIDIRAVCALLAQQGEHLARCRGRPVSRSRQSGLLYALARRRRARCIGGGLPWLVPEMPVSRRVAPQKPMSLGKAPTLDTLLALSPDEPLLAAEPYYEDKDKLPDGAVLIKTRTRGTYIIVQRKWTKRQLELRRRYPGLQLDYHFREARKYNRPWGEPLSDWVREILTTAKMHWSRAVHGNRSAKHIGLSINYTNLQFRDWLPSYMDEDGGMQGGRECDEARRIIRIACGLPRFAPTKPGRAGR